MNDFHVYMLCRKIKFFLRVNEFIELLFSSGSQRWTLDSPSINVPVTNVLLDEPAPNTRGLKVRWLG